MHGLDRLEHRAESLIPLPPCSHEVEKRAPWQRFCFHPVMLRRRRSRDCPKLLTSEKN
jgi:hypothetical protein